MDSKLSITCLAGLILALAGFPAGSSAAGTEGPATSVSDADAGDADSAALPAGVTAEWLAEAQNAIRQARDSDRDVAAIPRPRPNWKAEGNQTNARFGHSVGMAGDVNGDGYDDVIVGAPFYDNGQQSEGGAFAYHGSASGLSPTPNWTAEGEQSALLGFSVGTAGDVNGDGYDDVIVGAYQSSNGQTAEGRALVYRGSASGLSITANWTAETNHEGDSFGWSVGSAGDVNGDGYDDVIVGAPGNPFLGVTKGRAFVYHGSASGLSATPDWTAESDQDLADFGKSVGTAGDVNGDGYDDVIVGASLYDNDQSNEGRAFVYYGSASGLSGIPDWKAEGNQANSYFGISVSTAGDVNDDGYDDVIVGQDHYGHGESAEGRASVYLGSASGLSITPDLTAESNQQASLFGTSVGTAGDVNGNGYDEVIVGAPVYRHGQIGEGVAVVFHGRATTAKPR